MKTKQELFDAGLAHIRAQGRPSVRSSPGVNRPICMYRATYGNGKVLKCVIGGLIPDEVYDPSWDGNNGKSIMDLPDEAFAAIGVDPHSGEALDLLNQMQHAHDDASGKPPSTFLQNFEEEMAQIATYFKLKYTPPGATA